MSGGRGGGGQGVSAGTGPAAQPPHRNQKHLRRDFLASSLAGGFATGDRSSRGGTATAGEPGAAAGEPGAACGSMWLSTRWKRPSCCRKSCSTLRRDEGTASAGSPRPRRHGPAPPAPRHRHGCDFACDGPGAAARPRWGQGQPGSVGPPWHPRAGLRIPGDTASRPTAAATGPVPSAGWVSGGDSRAVPVTAR